MPRGISHGRGGQTGNSHEPASKAVWCPLNVKTEPRGVPGLVVDPPRWSDASPTHRPVPHDRVRGVTYVDPTARQSVHQVLGVLDPPEELFAREACTRYGLAAYDESAPRGGVLHLLRTPVDPVGEDNRYLVWPRRHPQQLRQRRRLGHTVIIHYPRMCPPLIGEELSQPPSMTTRGTQVLAGWHQSTGDRVGQTRSGDVYRVSSVVHHKQAVRPPFLDLQCTKAIVQALGRAEREYECENLRLVHAAPHGRRHGYPSRPSAGAPGVDAKAQIQRRNVDTIALVGHLAVGRGPRMRPLVTVGIPVFNGERFLAETVESVLAQDLEDVVVLVADNGSTDATPELCRGYARRDPRVRFLPSDRNRGAAWNYNRLVDEASTPYFKWQAADDLIRPTFLSSCVEVLETRPDVVLAYSPAEYIDERGDHLSFVTNPRGYGEPAAAGRRIRSVLGVTTQCFEVFGVMRASALSRTSRIGAYPASDVVLLAELALLGRYAQVEDPLFLHRMHRDRSVFQHADQRDLVKWYSPDAPRLAAPRWRLLRELAAAFLSLPVSSRTRAVALAALIPWAVRHRLQLTYDLAACMPTPISRPARMVRDRRRRRLVTARSGGHGGHP